MDFIGNGRENRLEVGLDANNNRTRRADDRGGEVCEAVWGRWRDQI